MTRPRFARPSMHDLIPRRGARLHRGDEDLPRRVVNAERGLQAALTQPAYYSAGIYLASSGAPTNTDTAANQKVGAGGGVATWTREFDIYPASSSSQLEHGYSRIVADLAPAGYWRLGESSGTTASDSSGNARHGTYAGSPALGATGLLTYDTNTAVDFDGSNDVVTVAYAAGLNPATFSVGAWIRPDAIGADMIIVANRNLGAFRGYAFYVSSAGKLSISIGSGAANVVLTGTATLVAGTAYHVVATYDGTNARLYINGALDVGPSARTFSANADQNLAIGATTGVGSPFNGIIDEVFVRSGAMTAAQVVENSQQTTNRLVARAAGLYDVSYGISFTSIADAKIASVAVAKNGTIVFGKRETLGAAAATLLGATEPIALAAGDYLELYAFQNDSASEAFLLSTPRANRLAMQYRGPSS